MALLAGVNYDPSTAASASTASLSAMAAIDTANLRLSFTAPSNGKVLVRIRATVTGATTFPQILLGVMSGASIIARQAPLAAIAGTAVASTQVTQEALFTVSGLTPGGNYTWDAAWAVQVAIALTALRWGGPNNTTTNDAWGGFQFEIWGAPGLLGSILYDPASAANKVCTGNLAITALDTTNLRITFTAPSSGKVLVRLRGLVHGATTFPMILLAVLDGSTVRARTTPIGGISATGLATTQIVREGQALVTGLTPGNSYTFDAAYGVEVLKASTGLKYGGPNNASGNNAFGGFLFEVWVA